MKVVEVQSLSKSFRVEEWPQGCKGLARLLARPRRRDVPAVDDITFSVEQGEQVAFIGPNGAGKSTTLKMLIGILFPTSGSANVLGLTPWDQRQELAHHIGIVFGQRSQLCSSLPALDSFDLLASIYSLDADTYRQRRTRIVEMLSIGHLLFMPVRQMSLGQRMRCEIAASLLLAPKVLFLDEPTVGDVASAFVLWMVFGKHDLADLPLLLLLSVSASALFLAAMIMLQSLAFLIAGINTSADNLFDVFITLALYPQNVYGSAVRLYYLR